MIGPGRLIMVVGPSGAGKDTLISGARSALAGEGRVVFPRRVVTRQSGDTEDHDTLSPAEFDLAAAQGAFSLSWDAHGLKYGIPVSVDEHIAAGRIAVCNMSRGVIAQARALRKCQRCFDRRSGRSIGGETRPPLARQRRADYATARKKCVHIGIRTGRRDPERWPCGHRNAASAGRHRVVSRMKRPLCYAAALIALRSCCGDRWNRDR
jgi:hypothetical protein